MSKEASSAYQQVTREKEVLVDADERQEEKTDCSEEERNDRTGEVTPFCNQRTGEETRAAHGDCCQSIKLIEKLKISSMKLEFYLNVPRLVHHMNFDRNSQEKASLFA